MSQPIITVEELSKRYVLGSIGSTSLREEFSRRWRGLVAAARRRPAPSDAAEASARDFWALRDVSFTVNRGEVLGVIGRNGAGKSTLLKILSRITEPTSGVARLRGRIASLLEVGTGFHPDLTGRENVFLNGAILGMTRDEIRRKFDEIVAFAEVERFIDTPVKRYSSGMYVRLAFAVAAHLEPEILIVDEVLAVGDSSFQKKCIGKIQAISSDDQRTVIFVSHNMQAVEHLCSRILHLEQGRLVGCGPTADMIAEYLRRMSDERLQVQNRNLTEGLQLLKLVVGPNTVGVSESVSFEICLAASAATTVHDFHLVLNNASGYRVALIDLRDEGGPYVFRPGDRANFTGTIARLPLVSGAYGIGMVLRTGREHEEFADLFHLEIRPSPPQGQLVPYAVQYQGTTVLDCTFETQGPRAQGP